MIRSRAKREGDRQIQQEVFMHSGGNGVEFETEAMNMVRRNPPPLAVGSSRPVVKQFAENQ
jgi:hypothetical protein